ncbi:MAG: hypothetical protein U0572_00095 [Phycisphaerales bacterium]
MDDWLHRVPPDERATFLAEIDRRCGAIVEAPPIPRSDQGASGLSYSAVVEWLRRQSPETLSQIAAAVPAIVRDSRSASTRADSPTDMAPEASPPGGHLDRRHGGGSTAEELGELRRALERFARGVGLEGPASQIAVSSATCQLLDVLAEFVRGGNALLDSARDARTFEFFKPSVKAWLLRHRGEDPLTNDLRDLLNGTSTRAASAVECVGQIFSIFGGLFSVVENVGPSVVDLVCRTFDPDRIAAAASRKLAWSPADAARWRAFRQKYDEVRRNQHGDDWARALLNHVSPEGASAPVARP